MGHGLGRCPKWERGSIGSNSRSGSDPSVMVQAKSKVTPWLAIAGHLGCREMLDGGAQAGPKRLRCYRARNRLRPILCPRKLKAQARSHTAQNKAGGPRKAKVRACRLSDMQRKATRTRRERHHGIPWRSRRGGGDWFSVPDLPPRSLQCRGCAVARGHPRQRAPKRFLETTVETLGSARRGVCLHHQHGKGMMAGRGRGRSKKGGAARVGAAWSFSPGRKEGKDGKKQIYPGPYAALARTAAPRQASQCIPIPP